MQQFNNLLRPGRNGFTLIELLVTVAISGVMVGLGIATYNSFNQRQTLSLTLRNLKTNLWATQTRAVANKQPTSGCTNFSGYKVTFADTSYTIAAQCDGGDVEATTVSLPSGMSKTLPLGSSAVTFKPLSSGTNLAANLTLTYTYQGTTETVTITPSGEIK